MLIAISGSQVSVLAGTLNIDDAIGERSTCSFVVRDNAGAMHFRKGQPVQVIDDEGRLVFAGVVDSAQEQKPGPRPLLLHRITCADWHYLADKRIAAKSYENMAAGDIVSDLLASYLHAEGVLGTRAQPTFSRSSVAYLSSGTQVAANVPRYETGKFAQAWFCEEGTTNTHPNPILAVDATGWAGAYRCTLTRTNERALFGSWSAKIVVGDPAVSWYAATRNDFTPANPNTVYAFSVYIYSATTNTGSACIEVNQFRSDKSWIIADILSASSLKKGEWERLTVTFTSHAETAYLSFRIRGTANAAPGDTFWATAAQEEKSYVTSFIDGTRSPETLTIPGSVLNPQEGTVEFTVIPSYNWNSSLGRLAGYFGCKGSAYNKSRILIYKDGNYLRCLFQNTDTTIAASIIKDISSLSNKDPLYLAASWKPGRIAFLVNGSLVGEVATTWNVTEAFTACYIGSGESGTVQSNSLIDDLRISSRARTDAETAAACQSGVPLPFDDATTYLLRFDGSLAAETPIQAGPTVKEAVVNYRPVSEALDALAEKAGFVWWIDAYKVLHFAERATYAAPWTATGADMRQDSVTVEHANPQYRNRQYIKGGRDITDPQVEIKPGDGNSRSFTVGFPIAKVPTVEVSRNGGAWTAQTVGIKGVDTGKQWYWSKGDPVLVQDDAEPVLGTADKVRITYQGEYDIVVLSEDYSAISDRQQVEGGGTGYVEDVADEPDTTTRDAAFQSANAKLKQYAQIGRRLKFRTRRSGLRPGQLLTVYLPEHKLDNVEMLIESVTVADEQGVIWYDVTAVEGPEQGSWSRMFKALATRGQAFVNQVNIGEGQTLVILQTFAESWPWAENVVCNVFACPVPSTTLYPSATLMPC